MAKRRRVRRDWPAVVQAQASSGLSVSAFCRQQGVSMSHFYRKRRQCQRADASAVDDGFVELRAVDPQPSGSGVAVAVAGGWRLELEPGFDTPTFERVLACLARRDTCSR